MTMIYNGHLIAKEGYEILEARPASKHPDDRHLLYVLAKRVSDGEYVTWMYNKSDKGMHFGHYYNNDQFELAYQKFWERD